MLLISETLRNGDEINYYPCERLDKIILFPYKKLIIVFPTYSFEVSYGYSLNAQNIRSVYDVIHNMIEHGDSMEVDEFIKKIKNTL